MASGCLLGLLPLFFYDAPSQGEGGTLGDSKQAVAAA
jgi:hypothetical protein